MASVPSGVDRTEIARRRAAALADIAHVVGSDAAALRVVNGEDLLIIARVVDKTARPAALQIVQQHFPGAAVKFEP